MNRHQDGRFPFGDAQGLEIRVGRPLTPHGQRLLDALGCTVVVDPDAPSFCCTNPDHQRRQHGPHDSRRPSEPTRDSSARGGGAPTPRKEKDRSAC